ncbi:clarin-3 [Colossoma macropomum]|uniref:clarin-3 n=1 Tax=Colossoma macropomum TaxID=42526 RepID=UPI0018647393|nr:clarin-3 [Colossoma macropomum]
MPSTEKIMYFLPSAVLSAGGLIILGYGMSTDWAHSTMSCTPLDSFDFNGSYTIQMGLFNGSENKLSCPRFNSVVVVTVFEKLKKIGGAAIALQGLVLGLLVLALVGSAGSILITLYNSISNPYETYMGPIGLFVCGGLSASSAFLALVLYIFNVFVVKIGEEMAKLDSDTILKDEKAHLLLGFYLLLPYIGVNVLAILLVFLYQHEAYTQRKEQERPTEDAPKDIMMF